MSAQTTTSRSGAATVTRDRIVVGIDGGAQGAGPLLWACQEADWAHVALQLVSASPTGTYLGTDPAESMRRSLAELTLRLCTDVEVLPAVPGSWPRRLPREVQRWLTPTGEPTLSDEAVHMLSLALGGSATAGAA